MTSEHDAPTVARATVWLDTSNDAPTKRAERVGDRDGDGGDRDGATAATVALEAAVDEVATTRYRSPELPQTEELHAMTALEPFATAASDRLGPASGIERRSARAALLRRTGERAAALFACALALAGAFVLGRSTHARPAAAAPYERRAPARASVARSSAPTAAPEPIPAATADAPSPTVDTRAAVEALASGDYDRALALYRALAGRHPNDAAFAAIVKRLGARRSARCTGEALCGG